MTTLFISHSSKDKRWAEEVRAALGEEGYESFLDSHPDDGIPVGAKWEQTLWQRLKRSRGVVVLCTTNWLASPWCVAEAMIARERGKPVFLLAAPDVADNRQLEGPRNTEAAPRVPDFLRDTQFISLAGLDAKEGYRRLWRGLEEEGLQDAFPEPTRPYPGLEPFQASDAAVFFGRDDDIARVMGALNRRRRNNAKGFILILGASGCGKSSLVRAGVLPQLNGTTGEDQSAGAWVIPPPFSSGKGLEGLVVSLGLAFKKAGHAPELDSIRTKLAPAARPAGGLVRAARALGKLASELLVAHGVTDGHLLLVPDQLEGCLRT